jgi:hypothetical protein
MFLKSLKLVINDIRTEDSADMALQRSATMDMRLNKLEIICRLLFLTSPNDD